MKFIQCKDEAEVEKYLDAVGGVGFISTDHRIYEEMMLVDEGGYWDMPASTVHALWDLQTSIECLTESGMELTFLEVKTAAAELDGKFRKALEAVKFKPMKRREK